MIYHKIITVQEGVRAIQDSFLGMKLAERTHNIYYVTKYRNAFEFLLRGLEESTDISMKTVAKSFRKLEEFN